MKKFLVNEDNVGLRLDAFLKKNDDQDKSRVYYQNTIDEGKVKVNSKIEKCSYKVNLNDEIIFEDLEEKELNVVPENIELNILYEDKDLLVVNKSRGMVVHPSNGHYDGGTLVNALYYIIVKIYHL